MAAKTYKAGARSRPPTHPGVSLKHFIEDSVDDNGKPLTLRGVARDVGVTPMAVSNIMNEKKPAAVTPAMALRLARFFKTTAKFWTDAQAEWDLYHTEQELRGELAKIKPVKKAA